MPNNKLKIEEWMNYIKMNMTLTDCSGYISSERFLHILDPVHVSNTPVA